MAEPRYLAKAPITEAVIDFRVRTPTDLPVEALKVVGESLVGEYEKPENMQLMEFGFAIQGGKPGKSHQVDHGLTGFRSKSTDGTRFVQCRKDGFTFSRLPPYEGWDTTFEEASRLYRIYAAAAKIEEVTRIGVRYINRLLLPADQVGDFSPFLVAPPPFPSQVPALITNFLTQLQVKQPDSPIQATVNQTIYQGAGIAPGSVPVILDIDVFEVANFSTDPDEVLLRFAALRNFKNQLFFASITEEAATLFE